MLIILLLELYTDLKQHKRHLIVGAQDMLEDLMIQIWPSLVVLDKY